MNKRICFIALIFLGLLPSCGEAAAPCPIDPMSEISSSSSSSLLIPDSEESQTIDDQEDGGPNHPDVCIYYDFATYEEVQEFLKVYESTNSCRFFVPDLTGIASETCKYNFSSAPVWSSMHDWHEPMDYPNPCLDFYEADWRKAGQVKWQISFWDVSLRTEFKAGKKAYLAKRREGGRNIVYDETEVGILSGKTDEEEEAKILSAFESKLQAASEVAQ